MEERTCNEEEKLVPYIAYESALARDERVFVRQNKIIAFLIVGWLATIGVFTWYLTLPVEEVTTESQSVEGTDLSDITQTIGD